MASIKVQMGMYGNLKRKAVIKFVKTIGLTFPKVVAPAQPPKESPKKGTTVKKSK